MPEFLDEFAASLAPKRDALKERFLRVLQIRWLIVSGKGFLLFGLISVTQLSVVLEYLN